MSKGAKKKGAERTLRIRQIRSAIGSIPAHREILRGLGLRRIRHEVERADSPAVRGMVNRVSHLVEIIEG
jgi:large subunit ribosomal protein L30